MKSGDALSAAGITGVEDLVGTASEVLARSIRTLFPAAAHIPIVVPCAHLPPTAVSSLAT